MTRIRTTLLAAGLCLASSSGLFADVAPKPRKTAPGPVLSTDMEDVEVQMKSEVVNLCLCKETKMHPEDDHASDYYSLEVEVTFEMVNHGEEVTFEEGFPCGPYQTMNNFSISVDGTKVDGVKLIDRAALRKKADGMDVPHEESVGDSKGGRSMGDIEDPKSASHDYWYVWDATFKANAKCIQVVTYTLSLSPKPGAGHTGYVLHTGAAWKDKIESAIVNLTFGGDFNIEHLRNIAPAGAVRGQAGVTWTFNDLEPTKDHDISIGYSFHKLHDEIARLKEEAARSWSGRSMFLDWFPRVPGFQGRETFTQDEWDTYLDTLSALIPEIRREGEKLVLPGSESPVIGHRSPDVPSEVLEAFRENHQCTPYANIRKSKKGERVATFDAFARLMRHALDVAVQHPEQTKAIEVVKRYRAFLQHFIDHTLYLDFTKLERHGDFNPRAGEIFQVPELTEKEKTRCEKLIRQADDAIDGVASDTSEIAPDQTEEDF